MNLPPFHLAFPIHDIEETRVFYRDLLGASVGREADRWIDFDFFGHQISAHIVDEPETRVPCNDVDGKAVPVRHFGLILDMPTWTALRDRLSDAGVEFLIEPHIRFPGESGEQATMFLSDPAGNGLEFKAFADFNSIFAK
ncbi:MAG: extradiol dioxygenase family protein [Bradymonadia bacterium]|jgi:extradiol dioxygenase family protein